jgi:competence protein ComEC
MRFQRWLPFCGIATLAVACSAAPDEGSSEDDNTSAKRITAKTVSAVADIPSSAPAHGHYRIHLIDVGSGLAVLVQGSDFTMLFDGGSGDDSRGIVAAGNKSRLLAYLYAALGPSGEKACAPEGDAWVAPKDGAQIKIDHVFLSHPHDDHVSMLDAVLRCYDVKNVWEPGMGYDNQEYGQYLDAVTQETGIEYHTVLPVPADRSQTVGGTNMTMPDGVSWTSFAENDQVTLSAGAKFKVLHADSASHSQNANLNSTVVRVQLGKVSLLLMGDAMAGEVTQPIDATPSFAEGALLQDHAKDIDVDILQVGHHGSSTSSRSAFIDAVSPQWALLSAGPRPYSGEVLPTARVVTMLSSKVKNVLRTDDHDKDGCPETDRVGVDDGAPGGCDNHVLEILP